MKRSLFFLIAFVIISFPSYSSDIRIESPTGGFTTSSIQEIKGEILGYNGNTATMVMNGIPQNIIVSGSKFQLNAVVAPGLNMVEIKADGSSKKVSFYAKVPSRDIKVLLTWDTATDVDLWVIDPKGNKCYYAERSTPTGGNLDTDVTSGYGPETFTMAKALPGSYSVQIQYYSGNDAPVTRVNVYVVLYEGTSKEKVLPYQFVMTREYQIYNVADFSIEDMEE